MIYFDNAATSGYKPECVINAVKNSLRYLSANPGRSGHSMSVKAALLVHKTRERLKEFLDLPRGDIVFTLNCTQSLNFAVLGSLREGGHVVTTAYEHNSVLRPLSELERAGKISLTILKPDETGAVNAAAVENALTYKTYLVCTNHVSNVTGAVTPVKEIGKLCKRKGVLYLVDAAQSAGYGALSMAEDNIDLLAAAPHKGLHAPQGAGILAIRENTRISPVLYGGTGTASEQVFQPSELPECLESGTLPTPAIAGISAALAYTKEHMEEHKTKLAALSDYALKGLYRINNITPYSAPCAAGGIVSFNIGTYHSADVANILSDQYDICVRGGLHCAPLIHQHLGTLCQGIVRASLGVDNTYQQIDFFLRAVKEIASGKM